jgi:hypothetical protein
LMLSDLGSSTASLTPFRNPVQFLALFRGLPVPRAADSPINARVI